MGVEVAPSQLNVDPVLITGSSIQNIFHLQYTVSEI
jgi:hypothetical protein